MTTEGPGVPHEDPVICLERWTGPWADDDPNANFKSDVALYSLLDPLRTIRGLAQGCDLPVGVVARYVLARFASGGSSGLMELGPSMVHRLWEPVDRAEEQGTDGARMEAYKQLRDMIGWLRAPLVNETYYSETETTTGI